MLGATTPEQMAVIKAAVERRGNQLFDQARKDGRREPREAYLMDALAQICEEWLRGEVRVAPSPTTTAGGAVGRRTVPAGYLGLLRLDVAALQRGHVDGDETCEIAGLGAVSVTAARRLLGDAVLKLVLTRGVDVANVTHLGRGPTAAQKVAMLWATPGCAVSGCPRMAGIEHDHRIDWAHTRHTVLGELDRLCGHHHNLKSRKGWALVTTPEGVVELVPPTDPCHLGDTRWRRPQPGTQISPRGSPTRAGPDPPSR
jgi:hypothetical protein